MLLLSVELPERLETFRPEAFSGGADEETDELLRERILASYASLPNGSNKAFYEAESLNTDGVAAVCVLPRNRGVGTVDIVVSSATGEPSSALLASVIDKFATQREICVDVAVSAPTTVAVPVSVAIAIDDGYAYETVAATVASALRQYFNGTLLGKDVLLAKVGNVVFGVEGVSNYSISLPAADITIADNQLPVAGAISVTRR